VRVNSDKQTLILAGEAIPRRDAANDLRPLTIVATLADDTMLLPQKPAPSSGEATSELMSIALPEGRNGLNRSSYALSRGSSFSSANEYARTQDLSGAGRRTAIIDTYA
jgi:hypothetical protein